MKIQGEQKVEKDVLNAADIAQRLSISITRVYQLVGSGELPHMVLGNRILFPRGAWETWLAARNEQALQVIDRSGQTNVKWELAEEVR